MRGSDPEIMKKISDYIGEYYRDHHSTPTTREIASAVGISSASGYNYLVSMSARGMLTYENGRITGLPKIDKTETRFFSAPLVGSIRCGDPEQEEEQVKKYVSLPESLFGTGEFYLLRAVGDSMTDRGIADGDLILVQKNVDHKVGDVVVALDEYNENTLKVYGGVDEESQKAILCYANESVYPGKRILVDRLIVQGVAKRVIKDL